MAENRKTLWFEPSSLEDSWDYFERHSGICGDSINPKYVEAVFKGKKLIDEACRVGVVYERARIDSIEDEAVILEGGQILNGKMAARVLDQSEELYVFVITLNGFSSFTTDDLMVEYFGDTWGTSYVECVQAKVADIISEELAAQNLKRTHVWCPGQTQFEIGNQKAIFSLLNPEDIGCTLSSHLMMKPVKSASGIVGVLPLDAADSLKPCDYCSFKKTCPASKKGCACL